MEYHISKNGKDENKGTRENPFLRINSAANIAQPGDKIIIHEGIYREWVNPIRGGLSNEERIIYEGAEKEQVEIRGSEIVQDWLEIGKGLWKTEINNLTFGDFNPFQEILEGDWFHSDQKIFHRGELYFNGHSLYEATSYEEMQKGQILAKSLEPDWSKYQWFAEVKETETILYANFHELSPLEALCEINVRPFCFWPSQTGINYLTVRNLILRQAATNWAPPTAEQTGLIGPNWSKGWIIENNIISDSKCSGISLGKEKSTGHNEWSQLKFKHGTQREREVVFRALELGWDKENIGSHIVRNNTIYNCEQTGICGHLGCIFSVIEGNHIYNIHHKRLFSGAEIGGIKLHAPIDTVISQNKIHHADRGIWLDWQTQGTRITKNLLWENTTDDLFIEVSHGPYIVDNNVFLSEVCLRDMSQGGAFIHNLFCGKMTNSPVLDRFTPYHHPHRTAIMGLMTIQGGDNHFYHNIFINPPTKNLPGVEEKTTNTEGAFFGKVPESTPTGTHIYNDYPTLGDSFWGEDMTLKSYHKHKFPLDCRQNLYINKAKPFDKEVGAIIVEKDLMMIKVINKNQNFFLQLFLNEELSPLLKIKEGKIINSRDFGKTIQTESFFENTNGDSIFFYRDLVDNIRSEEIFFGPLQKLNIGDNTILI